MKVRAIAQGFYNGRRKVGDVFEVRDGASASWWEAVKPQPTAPVEIPAPKAKKAGKKEPEKAIEAEPGNDDLV